MYDTLSRGTPPFKQSGSKQPESDDVRKETLRSGTMKGERVHFGKCNE